MKRAIAIFLVCALLLSGQSGKQQQLAISQKISSGGAASTCGHNTSNHGTLDSGNNNTIRADQCTTGANVLGYAVVSVSIYVATAGGNLQAAIYADSLGAPPNAAPLCTTAQTAAVGGQVNTLTISGCGTLTLLTSYWLAWNNDNAAIEYGASANGTGGTGSGSSSSFNSWPSTASSWNSNSWDYQMYINVTAN